jgi:phosphohistidine phosphatase
LELYVVRHGEAAPQAAGGDRERALTERGALAAERVGVGLATLGVTLDALLASPLRRAQETARILARSLGAEPRTEDALDGGASATDLLRVLPDWTRGRRRVALVGHQPVLGELVTLASFGPGRPCVALPPAGVARIDFPGAPRVAGAELVWLATPDLLDRVGRA